MHSSILKHAGLVAVLSLAGCATAPPATAPESAAGEIDRQILEVAERVQSAQAALYQAGALNEITAKPPGSITEDKQRLSVTWQGDATQLLDKLARNRGVTFVIVGVRLPLPVNLNLKEVAFDDALDLIQAQVGYRAVISRTPERLILQFSRPQV